jgi:3-phosphoshikimate 1-carboxyvinyltransferase
VKNDTISVQRQRVTGNRSRGARRHFFGGFLLRGGGLRPGWQITVRDVGTNPTRTGILDVLRAMGAEVQIDNERTAGETLGDITVRGGALRATEIGGALIPRLIDELPGLALLATQCEGTTIIRDAAEMRVKESDRIAIITRELRKLGANIEEQPDGMIIHGLDAINWRPRCFAARRSPHCHDAGGCQFNCCRRNHTGERAGCHEFVS